MSSIDNFSETASRSPKLVLNRRYYQKLRFSLYLLVVILLNVAAAFYSLRFDLTEQKTYSLAPASKATVAQLEEPVTIRVYLSSNLPSSYNILSSLLRDLLQTYQGSARRGMFSYSVNLVSDDRSEKMRKLQKEAENYGIYPVKLQSSGGNKITAVSAYIGMVITQGDNQEIVSPLQPNDNIQYKITTALQKMSRKSSALLSLNENLKVYYYFSPSISQLNGGKYAGFPRNFEEVMKSTAEQLYGRVESQIIDPSQLPPGLPEPGELGLPETEISGADGRAEKVYSAVVIDNEGRYQGFSLLQMQPTLQLGPDGLTQSNEVNVVDPLRLDGQLSDIAVSTLGITQNIGYIADRETANFNPPNPQRPAQGANLYKFSQDAGDLYNFQAVNLDDGIGKDINVLMLVDPQKQLSNWDLYQLDQFVMRGGRLIVAMEPYQVMRNPYGYGAQYIPNPNIEGIGSNGEKTEAYTLIDFLKHYGIEYQNNMVFDKYSFIQRGQNPQTGGYEETKVYYIPEIDMEWGSEVSFIKGLKKIYMYNTAPLSVPSVADDSASGAKKGTATDALVLLKSSPESWVENMSEGAKDVSSIFPPGADKLAQHNLIMTTQGLLTSFFEGKEIPQKPEKKSAPDSGADADKGGEAEAVNDLSLAGIQDTFIPNSEHGRILVSGTSLLFDAQLLSVPSNQALALNLLDYMGGNELMADLRARIGAPNFIDATASNGLKNFIKWFNVLGLPFLVGLLGLLMLLNWRQRQLQLRLLFAGVDLALPQGGRSAADGENEGRI